MPYSAYNENVNVDIFEAGPVDPQDREVDDSIRSGTSITPFVPTQIDQKTSIGTPTPNLSDKTPVKLGTKKMNEKQKTADPVDIYNLSDLEEAQEDLENDPALK